MKEIYFIRHGETEFNKLSKAQGGGQDSDLNDIGKEQAEYTGKYLKEYRIKDKQFDAIYASPLKRAKHTAEIIAREINYTDGIILDNNLREKHDGELGNGLTWKEMSDHPKFKSYVKMWDIINKDKDPIELWKAFDNENLQEHIKEKWGGKEYETRNDILIRLKKFVKTIKKTKAKKILVVCHNGTIMDLLERCWRW